VDTGTNVEIRVSDTGDGVPAHLTDRLFQRFTTGEKSSGTGLGLFIVRELARAHHGEAFYEPPSPGQASGTFVISLPRTEPAASGDTTRALAAVDGTHA
jgi:hypothetical protein